MRFDRAPRLLLKRAARRESPGSANGDDLSTRSSERVVFRSFRRARDVVRGADPSLDASPGCEADDDGKTPLTSHETAACLLPSEASPQGTSRRVGEGPQGGRRGRAQRARQRRREQRRPHEVPDQPVHAEHHRPPPPGARSPDGTLQRNINASVYPVLVFSLGSDAALVRFFSSPPPVILPLTLLSPTP